MSDFKLLHAAAEAAPFVRTGGLGDVIGALPAAQAALGADVRVLIPGYPQVLATLPETRVVATFQSPRSGNFCRLLATNATAPAPALPDPVAQPPFPRGSLTWYILDCRWRFDRGGGPYEDRSGRPWHDNDLRFGLLSWVAAQLASGGMDQHWRPDLLHVHDWHAALAPWWLRSRPGAAVVTALSIHNIGYQGLYPPNRLAELGLPATDWHPGALEYYGQLSFLKAGIIAARGVGTVSPTHALEILTPEIGHGMDGVLRHRGELPIGILNGIDTRDWNPETDPALVSHFGGCTIDAPQLARRDRNRLALGAALGLSGQTRAGARHLLLGLISRFAEQKGIDLVVQAAPALLAAGCDLAVLGSGDRALEVSLTELARRYPGRISTTIGFDDSLARQIYAGADAILVPSRYEPCGLTQMYAMRYGALPIVRHTGGLADTVNEHNGFTFERAEASALIDAVVRARAVFDDPSAWHERMVAALREDHSWGRAAAAYLDWYRTLGATLPKGAP